MSIRAEADKSVESQTPNVNRNKTENIEAGNISNENAEKRADIGKNREPTPAGTSANTESCVLLMCCLLRMLCCRAGSFACRGTGI